MKQKLVTRLKRMMACDDATEWIEENKIETIQKAWNKCKNGCWMSWWVERIGNQNISDLIGEVCRRGNCLNCAKRIRRILPIAPDRKRK